MAHDVFISHSKSDKAVADLICSRLEQSGIRCWVAPRDVRPGRTWGSEIIRGLDNAKVMIVVLSASSNRSRPVIKEVERAFGKDKVIITVRTAEVVLSQDLEFFLSSDQWLDAIAPPLEAHLDRLAHTVKEYLVELGWTEVEGAAASSHAPAASAERLSKEDAGETRQTETTSLSSATKEYPFVNSLGMRFVPVPGTNVLFSIWETRVKDYQAFCDGTGRSWEKPDFSQTADHPAVKVNWEDAKAFCEWLSRKEGKMYRLPTDHEWSCAVGLGDREDVAATPESKNGQIADVFPWGKQWPPPNDAGNYFGEESKKPAALAELKAAGYDPSDFTVIEGFNDGNVFTTAVGSFRPNGLGIHDLGGNVWEWCQDEYEPGSALRVLRGGSWFEIGRDYMLSSSRYSFDPAAHRYEYIGFRAVVEAGSGR
jgi:hypothetical protein